MNLTEEKVIKGWEQIWEDYYEHIVYIPWQPLDENGQITNQQTESQRDYISNFEDVTNFVGFINTDEMLFSEQDLDLATFLSTNALKDYKAVRFRQKKFSNRFCMPNSLQLAINQTFLGLTSGWEQKVFYQTEQFYPGQNIHSGKLLSGSQLHTDISQWRFNHYNLVQGMITFMHIDRSNQTRMAYDNSGMDRYGEVIKKICNGRCSESFGVVCDMTYFRCPDMDREYPLPYGRKPNK